MKPLTKNQRNLSIFILGLIFIISAPIIIFYSFGYRLNDGFTFQKTGGIFIHSKMPNTAVFLEDEYFKDNGLFVRNILIQDLTPNKSYTVRIQKDGYQSWIKELLVYPSIVTESRVLMLSQEYVVREILPYINTEGVATNTPPTKLAKPSNEEYITTTTLFATSTKVSASKATNTKPLSATPTVEIEKTKLELFFESVGVKDQSTLKNLIINGKEISWLTKDGIILYWTDKKETAPYYYCGGIERECKTSLSLNWRDIKRFDYFPGRSDVWVVLTTGGIYAVEVDERSQRNIQKIYEGRNLDFRLAQGGRLIIQDGSSFFEINL